MTPGPTPAGQVPMLFASRHDAVGFAQRTRKNLDYIESAFAKGEEVHVVTHLINSLLGLIVLSFERHFADRFKSLTIKDLQAKGWPEWTILKGFANTLYDLIKMLRHATAHGHIAFSSNSRNINDVEITAENYPSKQAPEPNWIARISAADLRVFCLRYVQLLEKGVP